MENIEINSADLTIESVQHLSGQIVGVRTGVRITHNPTGIMVENRSERSQLQNRRIAMALLKAKLEKKGLI